MSGSPRLSLSVAESEEKRIAAWVGYLKLPAPFDGVIVARNANTFDFVLPSTGDPTAIQNAPHLSPGGAAPIYVVDRTDIVRIFVDIPEQDANYVHIGTKATVLAKGYRDQPIPGSVTRTSWALNVKSRTLRAEIDLPNPQQPAIAGHVCVCQGDYRASRCADSAAHGPDALRREDLLLEAREWQGGASRDPDGRERRRVDRGHQLPASPWHQRSR